MSVAGEEAFEVAAAVLDPELPMVTIADLGILRAVETNGAAVVVTLTPTYVSCPAMDTIRADVDAALRCAGWAEVRVVTRLDPPWTTDLISGSGRAKLAAAGMAPPGPAGPVSLGLPGRRPPAPPCPSCGSASTERMSRFGATACTALWRCSSCADPFSQVKPI